MRGVPGWQLTRCIVPTLLRGAESIRMIYRARAGTFFCIFFVFLARGSVGLKSMLWVCGTILPKKMKKEDMQICFFFYPLSSLRDPLCIGRRRDLFSRHSTNNDVRAFLSFVRVVRSSFSSSSSSVRERLQNSSSMAKKNNNNNNNNASLKLSGVPRPGEAIRAVLLGHLNLDSNADATIEFQWYKKEYQGPEGKAQQQRQKGDPDRREELSEDEREILGATAPIYLVRKVDLGCRIGALAILRSRISDEDDEDDFDKDDEVFEKKKKEGSKILATFKSEMADIVHMENDDVDEDYYGDDAPGERKKKMSKSWRMQQKSKTSSSSSRRRRRRRRRRK